MSEEDRFRWDTKWRTFGSPPQPNLFLVRNARFLSGRVGLDVACGLGQNTVFLAQRGYHMLGVDVSYVALRRAVSLSKVAGTSLRTCFAQVDLDQWQPPPASVDLLCVFRFLDRRLFPALRAALRPGGLLFYQTRHMGIAARHPDANTDYLLEEGELGAQFAGWRTLDQQRDEENEGVLLRKPHRAC